MQLTNALQELLPREHRRTTEGEIKTPVVRQDEAFFQRVDPSEAVRSGEVNPAVDPDRLVELIGGGTLMRLLMQPQQPLGDDWVDQTAAIVVHGVQK